MTDQKHTKEPATGKDLMRIMDDERTKGLAARAKLCLDALAGIADPEAFMRDVRAFMRNLEFNGEGDWVALGMDINEHLKGGE